MSGDMADGVTPPIYIMILFHIMAGCMMSAVVLLQTLVRRKTVFYALSSKLIPKQITVPSTVH